MASFCHSLTRKCRTVLHFLVRLLQCGGKPEQAANRFGIGFFTDKYRSHSKFHPPFLLYTPFPCCGAHKGNSNGRIVCHCLLQLAMKLVVAQFCRAKDHEIINEGAECVQSENAMQFLHHHEPAAS